MSVTLSLRSHSLLFLDHARHAVNTDNRHMPEIIEGSKIKKKEVQLDGRKTTYLFLVDENNSKKEKYFHMAQKSLSKEEVDNSRDRKLMRNQYEKQYLKCAILAILLITVFVLTTTFYTGIKITLSLYPNHKLFSAISTPLMGLTSSAIIGICAISIYSFSFYTKTTYTY